MTERVQVIHGKRPILLICPHGVDDHNTAQMTEECAYYINGNAVINWGFERDNVVDVLKDKADCNRFDHVTQDVVREEYLDQIFKTRSRIGNLIPNGKNPYVYVYYIHGFGKAPEIEANQNIDLILGYGEGEIKSSYTCPQWMVDHMIHNWENSGVNSGSVFCGKAGGAYSARLMNNLCQLFTKQYPDKYVRSMQIEVSSRLRSSKTLAEFHAASLGEAFLGILADGFFDTTLERKYI